MKWLWLRVSARVVGWVQMTLTSFGVADQTGNRRIGQISSRLIARAELQLCVVLAIAVLLPLVGRLIFGDLTIDNKQLLQTALASGIALVCGFFLYRRLADFPGAEASNYIWISLTATFGLTLLLFFMLRFEYSRFLFVMSYILSIVSIYGFFTATRRTQTFRFALVPGGEANRLMTIPGVEWVLLKSPEMLDRTYDGVVADLRNDFDHGWMRCITESAVSGIPVYHFKQIHESFTGRIDIEHLSENNLGSLIPGRLYIKLKLVVDWMAAVVVLPLVVPVSLLVALAIRLDSPGPAIFRQKRMGFRGQVFTMYKFRTMTNNPQDESGLIDQAITKDGDQRVTRVGRFLRRTRIDEVPQIINILLGEMSWIGPRPEAVLLSEWYESELPFYRYRHIVRPGISGWAQVRQGHVAAADEVLEKLHYDFYYIKNCSLWLDLLIALRTVPTMWGGFGAR